MFDAKKMRFSKALALILSLLLVLSTLAACGHAKLNDNGDVPVPDAGGELVLLPDDETAGSPDTPEEHTLSPPDEQENAEAGEEADEEVAPPIADPDDTPEEELPEEPLIDENGTYDSKDDVALYLHVYGRLPSNYLTKKEAQSLGWEGGSLEPYAPGCCIGGSVFGNYEGKLPAKKGRTYHECDIDTLGKKSRGAKRIVYSDDGLIYYTDDHYETFTLVYGEE